MLLSSNQVNISDDKNWNNVKPVFEITSAQHKVRKQIRKKNCHATIVTKFSMGNVVCKKVNGQYVVYKKRSTSVSHNYSDAILKVSVW